MRQSQLTPAAPARPLRPALRRALQRPVLLAGAAYVLASFLLFGLRVAPHPNGRIAGAGSDPQIFIWSFAWWPHALGSGINPFAATAIWAPDGANLA